MKKSILTTVAFAFLAGTLSFTACNTPAKKVENAREDVVEAKKDLKEANQAYLADIRDYRSETTLKFRDNRERIAAFNARTETEKKEAYADYKRRVAELEQQNTDMMNRLDNYRENGKDDWDSFKTEFNRDMDRLGKALGDLTVKNVKK